MFRCYLDTPRGHQVSFLASLSVSADHVTVLIMFVALPGCDFSTLNLCDDFLNGKLMGEVVDLPAPGTFCLPGGSLSIP